MLPFDLTSYLINEICVLVKKHKQPHHRDQMRIRFKEVIKIFKMRMPILDRLRGKKCTSKCIQTDFKKSLNLVWMDETSLSSSQIVYQYEREKHPQD